MNAKRLFSALILLIAMSSVLQAQTERRSKGIGFRWGFWNQGNRTNLVTYVERDGMEFIETAGLGGWIYFFSRSGDKWVFEFSVGAFAQVEEENFNNFEDHLDVNLTIPILLGVRRDLLDIDNSSALRPYISFGGGPYWITNVMEDEPFGDQEVVSTMRGGAYFGGGMDFFLSKSFGINFDIKYHAVDLDFDNEISGLEVGLGFSISWGEYKPSRR